LRLNAPLSRFDLLIYGRYRLVHGLRIALAFTLTFLLTRELKLPESTWPLITLVVVMGPISFWGNVLSRALQRVVGTVFGAACGVVALYLELYSLPLMLAWCCAIMFLCGYLALGKRPYVGLLIGITLGVIVGGVPGDIETALWRSGDVILGSVLALLFCSIYPQRAYTHWRLQMHDTLQQAGRLYHTHLSPNVLERPKLTRSHARLLAKIVSLRPLLAPAVKETRLGSPLFEATQTTLRNSVCTLEMLANTYWRDRQSHFLMQSHPGFAPASRRRSRCSPNSPSCSRAAIPRRPTRPSAACKRPPPGSMGTQARRQARDTTPPLAATSGSISISSSSSPTSIACWGWCCNPMPSPRPAPDRAACNRPQKSPADAGLVCLGLAP
jgi:uncharacterized membrane protein YccC